ncbi:hypothetical protein CEXT_77161 [Caerostris extrusa]|uniref:Uncharacterized protein n=1 Tax=Caerostris extrusa TaxID=172846 RepID=A0AAV4P2J3_CAEEX|nr:hypothetical protein CEXT_77161 [Caerostris extrusa]
MNNEDGGHGFMRPASPTDHYESRAPGTVCFAQTSSLTTPLDHVWGSCPLTLDAAHMISVVSVLFDNYMLHEKGRGRQNGVSSPLPPTVSWGDWPLYFPVIDSRQHSSPPQATQTTFDKTGASLVCGSFRERLLETISVFCQCRLTSLLLSDIRHLMAPGFLEFPKEGQSHRMSDGAWFPGISKRGRKCP